MMMSIENVYRAQNYPFSQIRSRIYKCTGMFTLRSLHVVKNANNLSDLHAMITGLDKNALHKIWSN